MKKHLPIFILLLNLTLHNASAQEPLRFETLTIAGHTYLNASLKRENASTAVIYHDEGIKRVAIKDLDENLRKTLGYDAQADAANRAQAAAQEKKSQEGAKLVASAAEREFWVLANTEEGLIVGGYDSRMRIVSTGSGRVGGGGGGFSYEEKIRNHKYAFIPHTPTTKNFTTEASFVALVAPAGQQRISDLDVVEKFALVRILPEKTKPKK